DHGLRRAGARRRHTGRPRCRHGHPSARTEARGRAASSDPPLPHAPPPRPSRGARLLRSPLGPRARAPHLGARIARGHARGADRPVPVAAALPRRALRGAVRHHLPRRSRRGGRDPPPPRPEPVTHRGPTVGYRFEEDGYVVTYIPDHEPYLGVVVDEVEPEWLS